MPSLQLESNNPRNESRLCLSVWKAALWRRAQASWWPWGSSICLWQGQLLAPWAVLDSAGSRRNQCDPSALVLSAEHHWSSLFSSGFSGTRERWREWSESCAGPWRWLGDWSLWHLERVWKTLSQEKMGEGSGWCYCLITWCVKVQKVEPEYSWQ